MTTKIIPILCIVLLLSACEKPEEKEARYMKRGNELFSAGDYEKARIEYKNAARLKPADPEVAYRVGLIDETEGNLKDAFGNFAHAAQQDPQYHPVLLKLAEYFMISGKYAEAQKRLDIIFHDAPDDVEARALHAALLFRQKNYTEAATEAQFALDKDPDNVVAVSVLASIDETQGDDGKAMTKIDAGLLRNPKNLSLLLLKANLCEKTKDLAEAGDVYRRIFAAAPKDLKYRVKLAKIYADAGRLDEAEKTLRDGIAALPDTWELQHQLVEFLSSYRSLEVSEQEIRRLIGAYPDRPEPYSWLTDLYMSRNELDRAETSLGDALAHSHSDAQQLAIKSALARVDYAKGKTDAARQFAGDTLSKDPNNLDALFIRARIEADQGSYQNAIADLRAILRDRPRTAPAISALAEILLKQGHLDLAIDTLNQLKDIDPLNLATRVRLAQLYALSNDAPKAMDILFEVTKLEPKLPIAWETTARIAINTHAWDTADSAIGKLDALDGQHKDATYLRGQLFDNTGKPDLAIKTYHTVIDLDPASPAGEQAMAALVSSSKRAGQLQDAIAYLAALKTISPMAHAILGECYLETNQRDLAIQSFDAAIAGGARQQDPYLERAKLFFADRDGKQALAMLEKASAAVPSDPRAAVMEAEILTKTGRPKDAIDLYAKILARNPDLDPIANNFAELIADSDYDDQKALEKAKEVAERFAVSNNPLLLDTLAWVYYRQGHTDQAQGLMVRAASMKADFPPQFHYHFGAILLAAGNNSQATTELQQATAEGADYPGFEEAKSLLAKVGGSH
jgi:cellulose synthase operon protein C